jgi:hypothetical protein
VEDIHRKEEAVVVVVVMPNLAEWDGKEAAEQEEEEVALAENGDVGVGVFFLNLKN